MKLKRPPTYIPDGILDKSKRVLMDDDAMDMINDLSAHACEKVRIAVEDTVQFIDEPILRSILTQRVAGMIVAMSMAATAKVVAHDGLHLSMKQCLDSVMESLYRAMLHSLAEGEKMAAEQKRALKRKADAAERRSRDARDRN